MRAIRLGCFPDSNSSLWGEHSDDPLPGSESAMWSRRPDLTVSPTLAWLAKLKPKLMRKA